jgi:hypothetical protein
LRVTKELRLGIALVCWFWMDLFGVRMRQELVFCS